MKNIITLSFSIVAIALVLSSCKKNDGTTPGTKPDSLVFGKYNPFSATAAPNGRFFVLENNMLYAYPTIYIITGSPATPKQRLSDSLYNIARYLIDNFPAYLMQHSSDSAVGCPGCADGQVIEFVAFSGTNVKKWALNTDTATLPVALRQYIWKAEVIIDQL